MGYLFLDDIKSPESYNTLERDFVTAMPIERKGKTISGTFGTFNIKDFWMIAGGLKMCEYCENEKILN